MWNARLRLASLWLSQVARVAADSCLYSVFLVGVVGLVRGVTLWQLILLLPAIFLAPLNGAVINSLPTHLVLMGSTGLAFVASFLFALFDGGFISLTLIAIATTNYGAARHAVFPPAARNCHVPLTRLNGWMETGAMLAIVGGLLVTLSATTDLRTNLAMYLGAVAVLCALPVKFPSDVRRSEAISAALDRFFGDCNRVISLPQVRGCLIGLACLRGLLAELIVLFVSAPDELVESAVWLFGGLAVGSFLAGCQPHARRVLGLVPIGAAGLTLGLLLFSLGVGPSPILLALLGIMAGLINVPLSATYQAIVPADARGNAMALRYMTDALGILLVGGMLFGLSQAEILSLHGQLWLLTGITFIAAIVSCRWLLRELLELLTELSIVPFYRVKAIGPGLDDFPMRGPLIVLSNHAAYLDPVWVAKIIPRQMIPMMTSAFFDLPVIRWLMVNVAGTIRVEASRFRREVPEIQQAIAVLDRGDSLLVFPEGSLRRKEDRPLRLFGQGIWHILRERPDTPVVVCWVEGNWGSYFSYRNGPPTKNKRIDIRRPIDIAVGPAQVLDRSLLEDQRATRQYLMQVCLETRRYLGLEPLTLENAGEETETNSN